MANQDRKGTRVDAGQTALVQEGANQALGETRPLQKGMQNLPDQPMQPVQITPSPEASGAAAPTSGPAAATPPSASQQPSAASDE